MYESMVGNADKPLEPAHLEHLFKVHGVEYEQHAQKHIALAATRTVKQNPNDEGVTVVDNRSASQGLQDMLKENYFITNLRINTITGDLEPSYSEEERNHWVVLDRVTRNGTRVELYNPFPNRLEEYSFGEYYRSVGGERSLGWWIKKKVNPTVAGPKANGVSVASAVSPGSRTGVNSLLHTEQSIQTPTFRVAIDNQTENKRDAEQYLRIRGEGNRPKTKLCGEFCVTFILGQSLDTSLKHWQEGLKRRDKPVELRELATLLQAYGFNRRKYILQKDAKREAETYYVVPNEERSIPSDPDGYFKSFSIDTVLEYWKGVQPDLYNSILGGNTNEPTGPDDLITLLKAYGYTRDDYSYYRPGSQESFGYAPGRDAEVVGKTHFVIAGVNIHGTTGRLQPSGVPHWVVVTKITPRGNLVGGNGGWVELYNPFPNCWEEYSYREFMKAFRGSSAGTTLWVKKDVSPVFTTQAPSPAKSKQDVKAKGNQNINSLQRTNKKRKSEDEKEKSKKKVTLEYDNNPPLDANQVVCEHLGVDAIPWEVGKWIGDKAGDDPFLAEELTDVLRESGILSLREPVINGKKIKAALLTDPDFSDTFKAAIKKKVEGLASSRLDPAFKVASAALPLFADRAIQEIQDLRKDMPVDAYKAYPEFRAWTLGLASKGSDPIESDIKKKLETLTTSKPDQRDPVRVCRTILTRFTSRAFEDEITKLHNDPKKIKEIRKIWGSKPNEEISFAQVRDWADGLSRKRDSKKKVYRVRRWGDPKMTKLGFDVKFLAAKGQSSNFQAVGLYNEATEFGAISNYLIIPREDVLRLEALQVEDEYEDKRGDDWLHQKMNWMCQHRGSIYMFGEKDDYKGEWPWRRAEGIRWGTLALGGNLVQVVGRDKFKVKLPGKESVDPVEVEMARLQGFTPDDWDRPLDELLAEGLVHRCFGVYAGNVLKDSPKGIVYSPFWSLEYPERWEFMPKPKNKPAPKALWIPFDYLENPPEETAINPQSNSG